MPKLTIPMRTEGKAVGCLLRLYKREPAFVQELERLRILYHPVVEEWLQTSVPGWVKMREALTRKEFLIARDYFLGVRQTLSNSLFTKLERLLAIPYPTLRTTNEKRHTDASHPLS